ncbi:hypothetical protein MICAK_2750003 [Microcystis aeruginosa PCC 9701]|uniref:Uncharacterized protein n=1 Tax=Microcystis aeruginosa PCC 9701 TaxID=721123 RepID=I4IRA0_MICAE|nr:hypothetical protein MICAK_2750003 [Microcystis aeruginosa PCC 9701]
MRFDNVPSGWSGSSTERFSGWDIIPTQVPKGRFLQEVYGIRPPLA